MTMDFKKLTNKKYLEDQIKNGSKYFNALEPRTRFLVLLLLAAIGLSFVFNTFIKPQRAAISKLKQEAVSVKNRVMAIRVQFPETDKEKRLLEKAERSLTLLKDELAALEAQLPHQDSLPELLSELVKQSSGYAIDFNQIKPISDKDKEDYERLNIELRFSTNYTGLVNYLRRLEGLSQFISTTAVYVSEKKQILSSGLEVTVELSTLLGDAGGFADDVQEKAVMDDVDTVEVARNPFMSKLKPVLKETGGREYRLTGIVGQSENPTAIINDEVYQIGDWIGSTQITDILSNTVTLQIGQENLVLTLED